MLFNDDETEFNSQLLFLLSKRKYYRAAVAVMKQDKDFCKAVDASGCTLLHFAVVYANAAITKYLIEFGANVDAQDRHGNTPLMKLLKSSPENFSSETCFKVDMVRILLAANANIHLRDEDGTSVWQTFSFVDTSVLHLLLQKLSEECLQDSRSIAEALIDANCPLPIAVYTGDVKVVTLMLDHGIPMVNTEKKESALHVAIDQLNADIIKIILERGVDLHATNASGRKPMSFFGLKFENTEKHFTVLKLLLDYEAHKIDDEFDNMQISAILEKGDRSAISLLFRYDLDFQKRDAEGRTILHYLACNKHSDVVEEMHERNFDFKHSDMKGLSALHFSLGKPKIMEFLIEHGVDVDCTGNGLSKTPLFAAYSNGDDRFLKCSITAKLETIELLLKHGADPQVKYKGLSIFENPPKSNEDQLKIEPIIARLVELEVLGTKIDKRIIDKIQGNFYLKSRYDGFHKKIIRMKECLLHESVSLFTLMTVSQRQFAYHMRNRDLAAKFMELQNRAAFALDMYFCNQLRRRFAEVAEVKKLRENAADVIFEISGFHHDRHHIIVNRILDNFSLEELRRFG